MKAKIIFLPIIFLAACKQSSLSYNSVYEHETNLESNTPEIENEAVDVGDGANSDNAPKPGQDFSFSSSVAYLAHDKAVKWDGCSKSARVRGGYDSDSSCGKAYIHYPKFAQHLNKYFFTCIIDAAQAAGYGKPEHVFINHVGTYNDRDARGSNSLSMHAYARAIDLGYISLFDNLGKKIRFSTNVRDYKGANKKFYDEFRQCWKETMPKKCQSGGRESSGSIGIPSSALGGNSLHNDHIHLSFPPCAG